MTIELRHAPYEFSLAERDAMAQACAGWRARCLARRWIHATFVGAERHRRLCYDDMIVEVCDGRDAE